MSTRRIHAEDAAAAAELVRLARGRPSDLIDPFPPCVETEVLVDMGARGKADPTHARVAVSGIAVAGYGALDYSPEMRRAQLVGPVVHPDERRKGLGGALLDDLIDQARVARQRYVRAAVGARNEAGRALLKRAGFRRKETHTCLRLARPASVPAIAAEGVDIRRVDPEDDHDAYFEFTRKLVPRQPKQTRSLLKSDAYVVVLAFKNDRPVGCVEVDLRHGAAASVENLDAPPSLLHRGLGNALLAEAMAAAFERDDVESVDLLVSGTDRARLDGLRDAGFQVRHELVGYELRV